MLSVLFATWNRASGVARVLPRYMELEPPKGGWHLFVIDNGSTDGTRDIIRQFEQQLPITYLYVAKPGKNAALNAAISHTQGDILVFTDDDVLPDSDWLVRLRDAADRQPNFTLFGGTIIPDWPEATPKWVRELHRFSGILYAATNRRTGPCEATDVWGPNMAVRAKVFTEGHLFDDAIGAEGNRWGPVETEFNNRLARLGHRAYFVAEARVKHIVRPEQISETWMLERAYRHGLGFYLYHQHLLERHNRRIIGLPPGIALRHLLYGIAAPLARLLPRSQPQFHILFQNQWYRGLVDYIREAEKTNK